MINCHTDYPGCKSKNLWPSIDAHFATGISATCKNSIWHWISVIVFWQPFYCFHLHSPLSLHCSLIIHINISFKIYFKVPANCRQSDYSRIQFLSINAHIHCQIRSMGRTRLRNGCQLHFHTAHKVQTCGCPFISQQIGNEIVIPLAILGICIKIEKLSVGKRTMYIDLSGWHTFDFGTWSSIIATRWGRWRSRWR